MIHRPWDQQEPIIDALTRWGLIDAFNTAIAKSNREEVELVLRNVGVDDETTYRMVSTLLSWQGDGPY